MTFLESLPAVVFMFLFVFLVVLLALTLLMPLFVYKIHVNVIKMLEELKILNSKLKRPSPKPPAGGVR